MLTVQLTDGMTIFVSRYKKQCKAVLNCSKPKLCNSGRQQRKKRNMNHSACVVLLVMSLYAAASEGELSQQHPKTYLCMRK